MVRIHIDSSLSCTFLNVTDTKNCSVHRCIIVGGVYMVIYKGTPSHDNNVFDMCILF